jgi:hypothetical protein
VDKILSILNSKLYSQSIVSKKNFELLTKARLWKYNNNNINEIIALEKKLNQFTTVFIDGVEIE